MLYLLIVYFFQEYKLSRPFSRRLYFGLKRLAAKLVSGIIFSHDGAVFPSETPYITLKNVFSKNKIFIS